MITFAQGLASNCRDFYYPDQTLCGNKLLARGYFFLLKLLLIKVIIFDNYTHFNINLPRKFISIGF